jgi:formylglycine-generating enzyme required for sulfatase activity
MEARPKIDELGAARAASDAVFARISPAAMRTRAVRERHRFVFYLGHLDAFDANLLRHAAEVASVRPAWDTLFARGIDPVGGAALPTDADADWPPTDEVRAYARATRDAIDAVLARVDAGVILDAMIEHRWMHVETRATLVPSGERFAWENERPARAIDVVAFAIAAFPTTNRDWLAFVDAGGYAARALWTDDDWAWRTADDVNAPRHWRRRGGAWLLRTLTAEEPLPLDAPVYVSHAEASAYARWKHARLPSEAEWQRAAYGSPDDRERAYPWGDAPPDATRGNFDCARDGTTPVGAHPRGASAWGVHDLIGNGWEWTSSVFAPIDATAFAVQPFYPGYSADFFDGRHFVLKGGSPRTAARLLRRSFRNWFQPHYPHVYATLRLVE